MITFLVARVPVGTSEVVLGPAGRLLRCQLDALGAVARAGGTAVREAAGRLDPGVAAAFAGLAAVVVASFLVAGAAALAASLRARPATPR